LFEQLIGFDLTGQNSHHYSAGFFFLKIAVQLYECAYRSFHYDLYTKSFLSARIVNMWNSLPNSVVDSCTVNAFKARLDKFWQHQLVKFDFTADLTGTGNRSEEVMK